MRWIVDGMNVIGTRPDAWWEDRHAAMVRLVHMLENCFHKQLVGHWVPKLTEMIPSYGRSLKDDAALCERVRKDTAEVLGLRTV